MSLRRIILMIGAILSGVAVFVPMYMIQVNHQTVRDGVVNIMSSPIYAIIILCADLVIIGGAIRNDGQPFEFSWRYKCKFELHD